MTTPPEVPRAAVPPAADNSAADDDHPDHRRYLAATALAALGIVYGDIGTSPLYAFRESFHPSHGIALIPENVLAAIMPIIIGEVTKPESRAEVPITPWTNVGM